MAPPALIVRSPLAAADLAGAMELSARTFGNHARFSAASEAWYFRHSHHDPAASAVGVLAGEVVAHWGVWGYRMRVGRAEVRCAGVGAVATAPAHRRRGFMARTAAHALVAMRARGYHLSVLFGIDGFYHRLGYVPAWPESRWHLRLADLPPGLARPPGLRRIPAAPTPALLRLHARAAAGLTGTALRPTYRRSWSGMRQGAEAWCWGDAARPAGYALVHEDGTTLVCAEAAGAPDAVLAALGALCRRRTLPLLRLDTLPYRSALAARLRGLNCRYEQQYAANGEAMVRVVDLPGCLSAMEPELTARLAGSELARYRGTLLLRGPEGAAALALGRGAVKAVPAPRGRAEAEVRGGWPLARLLLGSDEPLAVCRAGGLRLAGDARRLVPVLFPAQHPQLQLADRF